VWPFDTVIERIGRKTIETILVLSAEQVAGARTPGKASGGIAGHGARRAGCSCRTARWR
jgi:hypothetical protein